MDRFGPPVRSPLGLWSSPPPKSLCSRRSGSRGWRSTVVRTTERSYRRALLNLLPTHTHHHNFVWLWLPRTFLTFFSGGNGQTGGGGSQRFSNVTREVLVYMRNVISGRKKNNVKKLLKKNSKVFDYWSRASKENHSQFSSAQKELAQAGPRRAKPGQARPSWAQVIFGIS